LLMHGKMKTEVDRGAFNYQDARDNDDHPTFNVYLINYKSKPGGHSDSNLHHNLCLSFPAVTREQPHRATHTRTRGHLGISVQDRKGHPAVLIHHQSGGQYWCVRATSASWKRLLRPTWLGLIGPSPPVMSVRTVISLGPPPSRTGTNMLLIY
jgi:hypothetical protein